MKRFFSFMMISVLGIGMVLFASSCGDKDENTGSMDTAAGNMVITQLSNADEAVNMLLQEVDAGAWEAYIDTDTSIDTSDRDKICFNIGVKSTNALLSVAMGDYDTAEELSDSIKNAARRLNIRSENVEVVVKRLLETLSEKNEALKRVKAKSALNQLQKEVSGTLSSIGNETEAVILEYGAWNEIVYQTSAVVKDNYSERAASVLRRVIEAEYFMKKFREFSQENNQPMYEKAAVSSGELYELMKNNKIIPIDLVVEIYEITKTVKAGFIE